MIVYIYLSFANYVDVLEFETGQEPDDLLWDLQYFIKELEYVDLTYPDGMVREVAAESLVEKMRWSYQKNDKYDSGLFLQQLLEMI
jgi:hypothetical protein